MAIHVDAYESMHGQYNDGAAALGGGDGAPSSAMSCMAEPDLFEAAFLRHEARIRAIRHPLPLHLNGRKAAERVLRAARRFLSVRPELEMLAPLLNLELIDSVVSLAHAYLHVDSVCCEAAGGASPELAAQYAHGLKLRRKFLLATRSLALSGVVAPTQPRTQRGALGHLALAHDLTVFAEFLRGHGDEMIRKARLTREDVKQANELALVLFGGAGSTQDRKRDLRARQLLRRQAGRVAESLQTQA
jgi:hypothetical protein